MMFRIRIAPLIGARICRTTRLRLSAISGLSISCQVLRFALAVTGPHLNDARMKLSRTNEFFARALTRGPKCEGRADSDAAEESAGASYRQKAQRLSGVAL